ncbi:MAG: uracil phosphoribosyltransferase [Akkermansiaceae bacterium]
MSNPQNHHIQHPVMQDRLARLRSKECLPANFRRYVHEIAQLMVPYTTDDLPTTATQVETPIQPTTGETLARGIILVPILRAGLGMLDGFLHLLPEASVAHIGMKRNEETLQPESYYFNVPPNISDASVLVLDPMLATGGSASASITELKKQGAQNIRFICMVAAPEGIAQLNEDHPDVPLYFPALDDKLNEHGYIVPGLGDAGDRIFGTI